ncbi:nucleoside 2-deoxyribosyltransferase [Mesorhizobium muleiense]|uniref:nucleoside 2-deoxyribosyltransferase n=1 Tax=Mesorhizobium muleiense TaxID=1004279 RepID=UPI001F2D9939|nr:nucleoside 2-deoxyribosyltransferase [Mesorhizobium muleiense]MCF6116869.1 nucleoside 2-deoxyribosyltransferase [Mesorhizobium muleiense]
MTKMNVYIAAPLFNRNELAFNAALANKIERHANVFLPQRDGSLLVNMLTAGIALEVAERRVFEQDRQAMIRSDLLVAVLDGAHIDEGVAFELGFASAIGCTCIGLQTDVRRALPTGNNPMIGGCLERIFQISDELFDWVSERAVVFERNSTVRPPLRA